jgi:dihydrodipicolinate synthase/N-acetylneuraminate lyase
MFKLKGVVPPLITPFQENGDLDLESLEILLDFLKDKTNGLYICGSYGSGPMMTLAERKLVAETCMACIGDKIPVVVHTGTACTRETVDLTRHAEEIGCQAAAAVGPYYFHHDAADVISFYGAMRRSVNPDFPIYVYHNPAFSGYEISLDTMRKLADLGINGIKDATFNILTFASYMREFSQDGLDVVLGTESMWASARALGAEAYIPGLGNAFPEICEKLWREGMNNDTAACRETQFKVNALRDVMYLARSTQLAVYAMLDIRNVVCAYPRAPFIPASHEEKEAIRSALQQLEVL